MTYSIPLRQPAPQPFLSVRAVVPAPELVTFFDAACNEMLAYLAQAGVRTAGPPMSLEAQGYAMAGPPHDVVLVGPRNTDDPAAYRTKVVYPIVRR